MVVHLCWQGRVWRLLAAILWLGNIEFKEAGDDSVTIADGEALHHASALLRVPADALASVLSSRVITVGMSRSQFSLCNSTSHSR